MEPNLQAVVSHLDDLGLSHTDRDNAVVLMVPSPIGGHPGVFKSHRPFVLFEFPRLLVAPPARHAEVARYLGRVNYSTAFGTWGLDFDGEVTLQFSLVADRQLPARDDVERLVRLAMTCLAEVLPRLVRVAFAGETADDADRQQRNPLEALSESMESGDSEPAPLPDDAEVAEALQRILGEDQEREVA